MDILNGIVFGFISGISEFLPISAIAHRRLFEIIAGVEDQALAALLAHIGSLCAIVWIYRLQLKRMRQEMRIAGSSRKRKLRNPDLAVVSTARMIWTASVPILLGVIGAKFLQHIADSLWLLALVLTVNGILLYIPQFSAAGGRTALAMRPLDGLLYGIFSAMSCIPGLSGISCTLLAGHRRRTDRAYVLDLCMYFLIPWLLGCIVLDVLAMFGGFAFSLTVFIGAVLAAAAAFAGTYGAVTLMRYLSVRIGFYAFAYYSWGLAFACFILYLMI